MCRDWLVYCYVWLFMGHSEMPWTNTSSLSLWNEIKWQGGCALWSVLLVIGYLQESGEGRSSFGNCLHLLDCVTAQLSLASSVLDCNYHL